MHSIARQLLRSTKELIGLANAAKGPVESVDDESIRVDTLLMTKRWHYLISFLSWLGLYFPMTSQ